MKTTRTPYGIEINDECNALLRARRRARALAYVGLILFTLLIGLSLGALVAWGAPIAIIILIGGWGAWGLSYLTVRH